MEILGVSVGIFLIVSSSTVFYLFKKNKNKIIIDKANDELNNSLFELYVCIKRKINKVR
jgi:hypothetical protein